MTMLAGGRIAPARLVTEIPEKNLDPSERFKFLRGRDVEPPAPAIPRRMVNAAYPEFLTDLAFLGNSVDLLVRMLSKPPTLQDFRQTLSTPADVPVPVYRLHRFLYLYTHSYDHNMRVYEAGDPPGTDAIEQWVRYALINH